MSAEKNITLYMTLHRINAASISSIDTRLLNNIGSQTRNEMKQKWTGECFRRTFSVHVVMEETFILVFVPVGLHVPHHFSMGLAADFVGIPDHFYFLGGLEYP